MWLSIALDIRCLFVTSSLRPFASSAWNERESANPEAMVVKDHAHVGEWASGCEVVKEL
jgi:hypothetical protein